MIKVHAFYCYGGGTSPVTFVFQHQDGTCFTFNSDCWEDGKPVLRKVEKLHYDIMGIRLARSRNDWSNAAVLNILMDNGEEFELCVDEHREYVAYGDYYLGVADDQFTIHACAFGGYPRSFRGWATRHHDGDEPRCYDVRDVHIRLERTGIHVGRESGSNSSYLEEFGWVLDYSTGVIIIDTVTQDDVTLGDYGDPAWTDDGIPPPFSVADSL